MSLDLFNQWIAGHPQWLGLVVFLIAFLECAAVVGLVLPGVVMLFAVAVLAGGGALGLGQTLLLAFAGGLLGDLCSYFLGRRFHQDIRRLPLLRHHPEWLAGAEGFVARYGVTSLVDFGHPATMTDLDVALRQAFEDVFGALEAPAIAQRQTAS